MTDQQMPLPLKIRHYDEGWEITDAHGVGFYLIGNRKNDQGAYGFYGPYETAEAALERKREVFGDEAVWVSRSQGTHGPVSDSVLEH